VSPDAGGSPAKRPGLFVAVVGPSGAGKDTLLRLAAERLRERSSIVFARRVVTRPAVAAIEDHDAMSEGAFNAAEAEGAFCLSWRAHGLAYGLPVRLDGQLSNGESIVANVSRRVLATAAERFRRVAVVEITASRAILVERIAARGREAPSEIAARLDRAAPLVIPAAAERLCRIDNDGAPEAGAATLAGFLCEATDPLGA
jgi:ribose 1,5-bisphosphokinase